MACDSDLRLGYFWQIGKSIGTRRYRGRSPFSRRGNITRRVPMIARLFASTLLTVALSQVAAAQSDTQQDQPSNSPQNMQAAPQDVPQTLRQRLTSAGYSDVRILPTSLVIT